MSDQDDPQTALKEDDPANLQRVIRHAVGLAREKRWAEAGVLLRRCVRLGAFAKAPLERPVLLGVFARELYAPAMLALMLGENEVKLEPTANGEHAEHAAQLSRAISVAREEAAALAHAYRLLRGGPDAAAPAPGVAVIDVSEATRELLLGQCAWEAGDAELAYKHFDEADTLNDGDITTNYWLMMSAAATRSQEMPSIMAFARDTALRALKPADGSEPTSDRDQLYAVLTCMRLRQEPEIVSAVLSKPHASGTLMAMLARARELKAQETPAQGAQVAIVRPSEPVQGGGFGEQLAGWAAWREIHRSVGHAPWIVAEAFKLGIARRPVPSPSGAG